MALCNMTIYGLINPNHYFVEVLNLKKRSGTMGLNSPAEQHLSETGNYKISCLLL